MPTALAAPLRKESADGNPRGSLTRRGWPAPFAPTVQTAFFRKLLAKLGLYSGNMPDNEHRVHEPSDAPTPSGFAAIGVFLFFGATMASLGAISLIWRGTSLDRMWSLNPTAYRQLLPLGRSVGMLFVLLGVALATAGIGWFRHRLWGWKLAVVIIATQVVGDVINCIRGDWLHGGFGVVIAGALLLFLLRPAVKKAFA
jgi:hypothetical protein